MGGRLLFFGLVVLQAATFIWPAAAQGALIDYQDGRLSADAQGVQAETLFAALEKQAGVRVQASKAVRDKSVSVSFRALELDAGMRQIVRSLGVPGYAVLYEPGATGHTYVLMDSASGAPSLAKPEVPIAVAAVPTPVPSPREYDMQELLELAKRRREERIRSDPERQRKMEAKRAEHEERRRASDERKRERAEKKLAHDAEKKAEREARRAAMREAAGANQQGGVGEEAVGRALQ